MSSVIHRHRRPAALTHLRQQPLLRFLELGRGGRQVEGRHPPVLYHLRAADEHVAHGPIGGDIDEAAQRVAQRSHRRHRGIHHDHVRLGAGRQPPDIVAPQRLRAAQRGGVEDVTGAQIERIAGHDARGIERVAQLLQHVVRVGIGTDADADAAPEIAPERLHGNAAPDEHRGAMGNGGAALQQRPEIVAPRPMRGRVMVEEDAVADDGPRPQHAQRIQPLDGRHAVPARDLVQLHDRLCRMNLERQLQPLRLGIAVADQLGRACVDLRRRHHAGEPPARVPSRRLHDGQRLVHGAAAGRLVPLVLDHMAVPRVPARRPVHGREHPAQAARGQRLHPALARHRQVGERRHARQ